MRGSQTLSIYNFLNFNLKSENPSETEIYQKNMRFGAGDSSAHEDLYEENHDQDEAPSPFHQDL